MFKVYSRLYTNYVKVYSGLYVNEAADLEEEEFESLDDPQTVSTRSLVKYCPYFRCWRFSKLLTVNFKIRCIAIKTHRTCLVSFQNERGSMTFESND